MISARVLKPARPMANKREQRTIVVTSGNAYDACYKHPRVVRCFNQFRHTSERCGPLRPGNVHQCADVIAGNVLQEPDGDACWIRKGRWPAVLPPWRCRLRLTGDIRICGSKPTRDYSYRRRHRPPQSDRGFSSGTLPICLRDLSVARPTMFAVSTPASAIRPDRGTRSAVSWPKWSGTPASWFLARRFHRH